MIERAVKQLLSAATGFSVLPYRDLKKDPRIVYTEVSTHRAVIIDETPSSFRSKKIQVDVWSKNYQTTKQIIESIEALHMYRGTQDNTEISLINVIDTPFKWEPEEGFYRSTIELMIHYDN